MDAQQIFESTFVALVNGDYSIPIGIARYYAVLEHVLLKVDFPIGTNSYMVPSNLKLNIGKTAEYQ